jgi:hypothetical protein
MTFHDLSEQRSCLKRDNGGFGPRAAHIGDVYEANTFDGRSSRDNIRKLRSCLGWQRFVPLDLHCGRLTRRHHLLDRCKAAPEIRAAAWRPNVLIPTIASVTPVPAQQEPGISQPSPPDSPMGIAHLSSRQVARPGMTAVPGVRNTTPGVQRRPGFARGSQPHPWRRSGATLTLCFGSVCLLQASEPCVLQARRALQAGRSGYEEVES